MQEDGLTEEYVERGDFEVKESVGWRHKLENFLESRYFVAVVVALTAVIFFSLGRISSIEEKREPVRIISSGEVKGVTTESLPPNPLPKVGGTEVIGSKSGTKYHLPTCPGAKQISEKNKITFNSIEEARAKGYTPAANCKGLK